MTKIDRSRCVQCDEEIEGLLALETGYLMVCTNPECPNYGLAAVAQDKLKLFK